MPTHLPSAPSVRFHSPFETVTGALVIVVAVCFFAFMLVRTGTGRLGSYELTVRMENAGGLAIGTDVRLAGVKIGSITGMSLDSGSYAAQLRIKIRDDIFLPKDSTVQISYPTMGDAHLSVTPGRSRELVPAGGRIDQIRPRPKRAGV